jgi:ABC-2 type transporter
VGIIVGTVAIDSLFCVRSREYLNLHVSFGVLSGTLFWQAAPGNPSSIVGALFQSMVYTIIGAMTVVVREFPNRSIFYKQQDANFYPTWTYVVGRSIASVPVALIDAFVYGTRKMGIPSISQRSVVAHVRCSCNRLDDILHDWACDQ